MSEKFQLDLETFEYLISKDFDYEVLRFFLEEVFFTHDIPKLANLSSTSSLLNNIIRYRIGQYLNSHRDRLGHNHDAWVQENTGLTPSQNRRYRRHARNIDERVANGQDLVAVLNLPALTLRASKTRQSTDVEQSLDALRNLRDDLQDKIVKK